MDDVAINKFVEAFDFLEENADALVTLPYASSRLWRLIRTTGLRNVRDGDLARVPLDRVESAVIERRLTEEIVCGFGRRLRRLTVKTDGRLPTAEMLKHLRGIELASLELHAEPRDLTAWTPFWSENEHLRELRLHCPPSKPLLLDSLPRTLTQLHLPNAYLDAMCLQACRESLTTLEAEYVARLADLEFPRLQTLRIGTCVNLPLVVPKLETFAYDCEAPPGNLVDFLDEQRLHLRELQIFNLSEPDITSLRLDRFPVLERLDIGVVKPEMPTSLKSLTVCTKDHRALHDYLKRTSELKYLKVLSYEKITFDDDTVLPFLEHLTLVSDRMPAFLDLRNFASLKILRLRVHGPGRTESVVRFPRAFLDALHVDSSGETSIEPVSKPNVRELHLKGKVNDSFLVSMLPGLRTLRLFAVSDERMAQILNLLRTNRNDAPFAVYVPKQHKKWESRFRRACPKLKIFEENESLDDDY